MVDSRSHPSVGPSYSAAARSLPPIGRRLKLSRRNASLRSATVNLSASEENLSFLHLQGVDAKKTPPSSLRKNRVQFQHVQSTDGPSVTPPATLEVRGHERGRRYASAGSSRRDLQAATSPDRFIPVREFNDPPSTPFRVSKSPQQLSPEEKLLRRRSPKADPFLSPRSQRAMSLPRVQSDRRHSPHYAPHMVDDAAVAGGHPRTGQSDSPRQDTPGSVWTVGGTSAALDRPPLPIPDGAGGLLGSGTTAPMYSAKFLPRATTEKEREQHASRVALALDIDPAARQMGTSRFWPLLESKPSPSSPEYERLSPFVWKDNAWRRAERDQWPTTATTAKGTIRAPPCRPFRVLEAPLLRDDFYCSALAYSSISGTLAVGLGHRVYLWSEDAGVQYPPFSNQHHSNYVTSLSFSSENGGKSILAVGRQTGLLCLWSSFDSDVRFEISHPNSLSCVAFKQTKSRRLSERFSNVEVDAEDLAVGDDVGNVWYYSVEWPEDGLRGRYDWNGTITLLAKIAAHTQQICGLVWSPDGIYLATGGNDNCCLLFELREIISLWELGCTSSSCQASHSPGAQCQHAFSYLTANAGPRRFFDRRHLISHLLPSWAHSNPRLPPFLLNHTGTLISGCERTAIVPSNRQKHRFVHSAAVKAIAFAPWQPSLLATGGGSNDRAIHFYHAPSGTCLATLNVYAQVTSLIWSSVRREIAVTFGYAQPEHPFRIAVFAWPSCEQISAIPWGPNGSSWDSLENGPFVDCGRVLWAVSYPGKPPGELMLDKLDDRSGVSHQPGKATGRGRSEPCRLSVGPSTTVRPREKEGGLWCSRTAEEGCIIVASSDQTVKFHEVWGGPRKRTASASGLLGGSEILEGLEGIEKPGREVIR